MIRISSDEAYRLLLEKEQKSGVVLHTFVADERHPLIQEISSKAQMQIQDIFMGGLFMFNSESEAEKFFDIFRNLPSEFFYVKKIIGGVIVESNARLHKNLCC
jgi:hypothetical protein